MHTIRTRPLYYSTYLHDISSRTYLIMDRIEDPLEARKYMVHMRARRKAR